MVCVAPQLLNNWVILGKVFNLSCLRFYTHEVEVRKGPPLEVCEDMP